MAAPHHRAGNIIGHDPVRTLAVKLGLGMGQHIMGFSGKADHQCGALRARAQGGQNVGVLGQLQRRHGA